MQPDSANHVLSLLGKIVGIAVSAKPSNSVNRLTASP
jgi:hypothetical protein